MKRWRVGKKISRGSGINSSDTFTYTTNSNLVATVTGHEHTVTNTWDTTRNVLASKENELPGGTLSKFTYSVNDIGQRVGLTPTGSAFANTTPFAWSYNDRGELTGATRDGLTAFERAYSYDGIGNRLTATDYNTATTSYFADTTGTDAGGNALNQYEKIEFPGSATIQPVHDSDGNMTSGPVPVVQKCFLQKCSDKKSKKNCDSGHVFLRAASVISSILRKFIAASIPTHSRSPGS